MISDQIMFDLFSNLELPDGNEPKFSTCKVPGFEGFLIGKSTSGDACLLLESESSDRPRPSYDLDSIRVDWNRLVRHSRLGEVTENRFTIIRAKDRDCDQVKLFFYVFVLLLNRFGPPLNSELVMDSVERCVQLFQRSKTQLSKTVLGFWSELLIICHSTDINAMVEAWHSNANEKYDFAFDGNLIEVKCTSGATRSHRFSADQLNPAIGVKCWIASIRTSALTNGTTVQELIEEAINRPGLTQSNVERILDITVSALGVDWSATKEQAFDRVQALGSLKIYCSTDVPAVRPIPAGVSDVHFTANLEFASVASNEDRSEYPLCLLFKS